MASELFNRTVRDYSPLPWFDFFDEAHDVTINQIYDDNNQLKSQDSFRVYLRNFQPPLSSPREPGTVISNLSNVEVTKEELDQYSQTPTLVTLHGGGYSGLTWAQFTRHIEQNCRCRVLSMDLRGHGDTKTSNDDQMDIDTLVDDVIKVIHSAHRICGFAETPKIVLIGHSMGGAIAVKCSIKCTDLLSSLAGFVIIDVVEGSAKDALPLMMSVIETRPVRFLSLTHAIEWTVRSGMAKNLDAARVSMPSNLLNIEEEHLGIHDIKIGDDNHGQQVKMFGCLTRHKFPISDDRLSSTRQFPVIRSPNSSVPVITPRVKALRPIQTSVGYPRPDLGVTTDSNVICEDPEEMNSESFSVNTVSQDEASVDQASNDTYKMPLSVKKTGYCWRTNLAKTEPFWTGWFDGLSEDLLNAPVQGKFLLLAGIDRLDKTLTIGQMQGKFMMKVLPKCGHAVHEDVPHEVALAIGQFLVRNKFTTSAHK